MNRMMKHWFMHPFATQNASPIKVGNENESLTFIAEDKNIYRFILHCIDPEKEEFKKRLDDTLNHTLVTNERRNSKDQPQRLRCVLCCWRCKKGMDVGEKITTVKVKLQQNCVSHAKY